MISKYTTKYLRTTTFEELFLECEKIGMVSEGQLILTTSNYCLVLLGTLRKATGELVEDDWGSEYPVTEEVPGYHANLRYKEPTGLEHLAIEISTPLVRFA